MRISTWLGGGWLVACALWLGSCLNPMPDDFPSQRESANLDSTPPTQSSADGNPAPTGAEPPIDLDDEDESAGTPETGAPDAGADPADGGPPADGEP